MKRFSRIAFWLCLATVTAIPLLYAINIAQSIASPIKIALPAEPTLPPSEKCQYSAVANYWKPYGDGLDFNAEVVAAQLAPYAAASLNVYDNSQVPLFGAAQQDMSGHAPGPFALSKLSPSWKFVGRDIQPMGYVADIYSISTDYRIVYVIAFRGTDLTPMGTWQFDDFIANASWFTRPLNPHDQYASARATVERVLGMVAKDAGSRSYLIVATGHSLGGGLARHVSNFAPCTLAVTFNASFVTNQQILARVRSNPHIEIFEDFDILSTIGHRFFGRPTADKISSYYQWYNLNLLPRSYIDQHEMMRFASGMARMALECQTDEASATRCEVGHDPNPYILYCASGLRGAEKERICANNIAILDD